MSDSIPLPRWHSLASERNKEPLLAVLKQVLGARGAALEIASGSGQHVACFAAGLANWSWQPTDRALTSSAITELDASIDFYCAREGTQRARVLPAKRLDVLVETDWLGIARYDAIYCANMLHIAPWDCCPALLQGAARHLEPNGLLITYGPYFDDNTQPAPGNVAFDADLRARNPAWGVRRLVDVTREASGAGFTLLNRIDMPANNLCLVLGRTR